MKKKTFKIYAFLLENAQITLDIRFANCRENKYWMKQILISW